MRFRSYFFYVLAGCELLVACTPKPLDIEPEPATRQIAISTTVLDANTVTLSATYSLNSLLNLNGGGSSQTTLDEAARALLVQGATVELRTGTRTYPLRQLLPGIYGSNSLNLQPYQRYDLTVQDPNAGGLPVTASTTYLPAVAVQQLLPKVTRTPTDTTVRLHLVVPDDPAREEYFLLSYSRVNPAKVTSPLGGVRASVLGADASKRLELFTDADARNGQISRDFSLDIRGHDTLYVHAGRIDRGYYEYLTAYRRTGSLITQLTSEPITLPTNVQPGLGYFSLYEATRAVFYLNDY